MCNCNQKRTQYAADQSRETLPQGMVRVKLIQQVPLVLNGDITGRTYIFETLNDIQWMDKRDLASMKGLTGLQIVP